MDFTGERLIPGDPKNQELYYEHLARYLFACRYVKNNNVLEIGCGAGYGSALLATSGAASVLALDNSHEAILYARENYPRKNLIYEVSEFPGKDAAYTNNRYDLIVCFEVLEHIRDQNSFVKNTAKLLAPNGVFILSTPNSEYSPPEKTSNPFHVKELNAGQLKTLLQTDFPNHRLLVQRKSEGIVIQPESSLNGIIETKPIDDETKIEAEYFIALCGKTSKPDPVMLEVPYFENIRYLKEHLKTLDKQIRRKNETIRQLQNENQEKNRVTAKLVRKVENLEKDLVNQDIQIINLERKLNDLENNFSYKFYNFFHPSIRFSKGLIAGLVSGLLSFLRLSVYLPRLILAFLSKAFTLLVSFPPAFILFITLLFSRPVNKKDFKNTPVKKSEKGISIIIPTWNGAKFLDSCIQSLKTSLETLHWPYEIIIVDGASTDDTQESIHENYPDIRLIPLDRNLGFAGNANTGAKEAKYDILYFLNNDMVARTGFLDKLMPCFDDPNVFAVSSNISMKTTSKIRETGLTEAEVKDGIVFLNHRKTDEQEIKPVFYAGGGASAFRKELFLKFGGFDSIFSPFYAEDLDISWKARRAGYTILWHPDSRVEHHHRGTITKLMSEKKADDILKRNVFLATLRNGISPSFIFSTTIGSLIAVLKGNLSPRAHFWALTKLPELIKRRAGDSYALVQEDQLLKQNRLILKQDSRRNKQGKYLILVLSPYCPYPPTHGGAVRMFELWKRMAKKHRVHFLSMVESQKEMDHHALLSKYFEKVKLVLKSPADQGKLLDPNSVLEFRQSTFTLEVQRFLNETNYDIVQVEYPNMAHFLPLNSIKTVITQIDVLFRTQIRKAKATRDPIKKAAAFFEGLRLFRYENVHAENADMVLTMSHDEKQYLQDRFKSYIEVCPNGVDTKRIHYSFPPASRQLVFAGNFRHSPNTNAICFFVHEIYPILRKIDSSYRLIIAGPNAPAEVEQFSQDPSIKVPGYVPDLFTLYRECGCMVAPITWGSGTRIKILEAMACGIPIVSTTIGSEGLEINNEEHLLLADTPEEFAHSVNTIVSDKNLARQLSAQARKLVEEKYDWDHIAERLDNLFHELMDQ